MLRVFDSIAIMRIPIGKNSNKMISGVDETRNTNEIVKEKISKANERRKCAILHVASILPILCVSVIKTNNGIIYFSFFILYLLLFKLLYNVFIT